MSALFTNHRNRGRASLRMLGIAMTVFMLLSVLTPLLQPAAAADDDPSLLDQEPTGEVVDEEETPPVDEPVVDDEVPPVDETPEALVYQLEPIAFYINKHDCPSDFDGEYYRLAANCDEPAYAAEFEVSGPHFDWDISGDFNWTGGASGFYTFRELLPSGYAEPIVYCKLSDSLGNNNGFFRAITYDGYYEVQIDPGLTLYCDWFNHPLEPVGGGTVIINKHFCDAGFDAYAADIYDLAAYCQTQEAGVTFDLWANGSIYDTQVTGGTGPVQFDNVPAVPLAIFEGAIDGYGEPVIYCKLTDAAGVATGMEQFTVGFEAAYFLAADVSVNETLYCDWFNIPEYNKYGVVEVIKYECPEVPAPEATFGDYQYECWEPQADVEFKLDGARTGNPGNYPTDEYGVVRWNERESDTYYLTETELEGYGTPVVFCAIYDKAENQTLEYVPYSVSADGQIEFDLAEGQSITCYWFNMPEHDKYGSITVIKYECLEVPDWEANYDLYKQTCTQPQADVDFKLTSDSTGDPGNYLTDANGEVTWGEREADHYYVTETIPSGYGTPIVYCDTYLPFDEQVPEYFGYEVSADGRIEFDLEEGQYIICYWFNIPEYEDSTVTVHKFICDEYVPLDEDQSYYQETCTVAHEGVTFNLNGESTGDQGSEVTDGDGNVAWDGLDTDLYTLDEEIPSGYGEPIVFCGFSAFSNGAIYDGFPVRIDEVYDGAVELDIEIPNSSYFCWYYNIPTYDTSITIYKWLCPENFDIYDDAEATCTEPLNGVTFTADGPDGYHQQSDTGDAIPYAVQFGSLEEGHYEIEETLPIGIEYGFVASCWGNSNPVPAVYPLYHTEWGGLFNIELAKGDQVSCNWYNVPEYEKEDGKLTVIKYLCSGYVVSDLNCDLYRDGQAFSLSAVSGEGDPIDFETGVDGKKTLTLPAGTWNLDEIGGEWCKAESYDLNEYGQIVTSEGHESVVYIYNCIPPTKTPPVKQPPTKQGPPIKEFPNTGSGSTAMAGGLSGSDLAGQGLILLLVAQGLVLIVLRRGGSFGFATRRNS